MVMIFKNSQETIEFTPSMFARYNNFNNKIGLKISGGADSAIVAYMLAKFAVAEMPEMVVYPITGVTPTKPYQEIYAKRVLEKVSELTGYHNWGQHTVGIATSENYMKDQEKIVKRAYEETGILTHFYGITANPTIDEAPELYAWRDKWGSPPGGIEERQKLSGTKKPWFAMRAPLVNVDKKGVAEHYTNQGVMDTLFPVTRSCEEFIDEPDYDQEHHCEKCYFCLERYWGFGRYI